MKNETQHRLDRAVELARTKSGVKSFKTGAVLSTKRSGKISEGWSHYSELNLTRYRSIHAELHAMLRIGLKSQAWGATIYVATIRSKSGNVGMGKPCPFCQELLYDVGVQRAWFTIEGKEYDYIDIG